MNLISQIPSMASSLALVATMAISTAGYAQAPGETCLPERSISQPQPYVFPPNLEFLNDDGTLTRVERTVRHPPGPEGYIVGYSVSYQNRNVLDNGNPRNEVMLLFNVDGGLVGAWSQRAEDISFATVGNATEYFMQGVDQLTLQACPPSESTDSNARGSAGGGDEVNPLRPNTGASAPTVNPDLIGNAPTGTVTITDLPSGGGSGVRNLHEDTMEQR